MIRSVLPQTSHRLLLSVKQIKIVKIISAYTLLTRFISHPAKDIDTLPVLIDYHTREITGDNPVAGIRKGIPTVGLDIIFEECIIKTLITKTAKNEILSGCFIPKAVMMVQLYRQGCYSGLFPLLIIQIERRYRSIPQRQVIQFINIKFTIRCIHEMSSQLQFYG